MDYNTRINVTKTFLPPLAEYESYLQQVWDADWITNQGPLLQRLEQELEAYLNVDNFHFVSNGTIALQIALKALGAEGGEVITTPFSYVATTSSILWERCTPVFVDVEPATFCIDPAQIEAAITPQTKAIMAVHVFGNPCDVDAIQAVADKHGLRVIYDGAHAFAVQYKGRSLLDYGDISTCSFHATKLFHTIEGGALIVRDKEVSDEVELIKRFGHNGDEHLRLGINAKASEFQAAMGLCNLKYVDKIIADRKRVCERYDELLGVVHPINKNVQPNYAYYPYVFDSEEQLQKVVAKLAVLNIFARRYFYPSLNTLAYVPKPTQSCPVSEDVAKRIICLPLYVGLEDEAIIRIAGVINDEKGR